MKINELIFLTYGFAIGVCVVALLMRPRKPQPPPPPKKEPQSCPDPEH